MANKKTVVQMYEEIMAIPGLTDEQKAFLAKRIEITQKKNASGKGENAKPTKTQLENEGIKASIMSTLAECEKAVSISELAKASAELAGYSNQKLSSLLTQLAKDNKIIRTEVKGRPYFSLPSADTETADEG